MNFFYSPKLTTFVFKPKIETVQEKVHHFIAKHQLLLQQSKVIVGLSGGADSVAMLHYLVNAGYTCIAAHCNFHLRNEESNRDEQFVKNICQKWNIQLEVIDFDTEKIAAERKISIEMAARDLRYEWFEQLRHNYGAESIAVAHHRDDNVETFLLNIIRGTGIRGLSGMAPKNNKIIRPFLCISRVEIEEYVLKNDLSFVVDHTNAETIYLRNKIRLELLPWLENINPSVRDSIERTSNQLNDVEQIYLAEIERYRALFVTKIDAIIYISIAQICAFPQSATLLFELLQPYKFSRSVCVEILESFNGISGKRFYSTDYVLVKDRTQLIIKKKEVVEDIVVEITEGKQFINYPISMSFDYLKIKDFCPENNKNSAYFDAAKLTYPLTLKHWKQGDWFVPFGMKGKKKLSDYFSDHKYDLIQKQEVWVLCSGNDIIWLVGERSDNRFRVDENTKIILQITIPQ